MNVNHADLAANDSSLAQSIFFCPYKPIFTWILSDKTTFYATVSIISTACPITILLNIVVITAVKKTRRLQNKSNILLASLALADLLVGAVSIPLNISLDVLLLCKAVNYPICEIAFANQLVLYAAVCSSLYHLTFIAWERYVAVKRSIRYKVIVTKSRVKKFAKISWFLAFLTTTPARVLKAAGVDYKYVELLNIILTLPAVICIIFIMYFYTMVYLGVRQQKVKNIHQGPALFKEKIERKIAKTTAILTAVLLISYSPSVGVLLFGEFVPFLRTSSFFRWSETLIQLNSLVNPFLYCFVLNRHFRNAIHNHNTDVIQLPTMSARQRMPLSSVNTVGDREQEAKDLAWSQCRNMSSKVSLINDKNT